MGPRGTIGLCVAITAVVHVVTYLLNTQLPLHLMALGGSHAQIGWLFAVTTSAAMVLRPQVGGWTDRYGARAVMLPGAGILVLTMAVLNLATTPLTFIALMAPLGIANALISTTGSIVVAEQSPPTGVARAWPSTTPPPRSAWRSGRRLASRWPRSVGLASTSPWWWPWRWSWPRWWPPSARPPAMRRRPAASGDCGARTRCRPRSR